MFKVVTSRMIVPNMHLLTLEAPAVAREAKPGQFIILRAEEEGERIPLSISDWDEQMGTVTTIFLTSTSPTFLTFPLASTTQEILVSCRMENSCSETTTLPSLGFPQELKKQAMSVMHMQTVIWRPKDFKIPSLADKKSIQGGCLICLELN